MSNQLSREDERQFVEHLGKAQTRLYSYIHMLVQDINDADDVFQQATLILWRKYADYDPSRSFFSWACGVARLEAMNFVRKRQRRPLLLSEQLDVLVVDSFSRVDSDQYDQRRDALLNCVQKLKEPDQELLREHYAGGISVRQIAEQLNRTPQSIHNSLYRIRMALLQCIRITIASETN